MISLVGKRPKIPKGFGTSVKTARARIARIVKKGKQLDDDAFEPKLWNAHKHILAKSQENKCAYCETPVSAKKNGVIDHYRPKISVQALEGGDRDDTQGKPGGRKEKGPREQGYPWLAYTWDNFLLTCHDCNEVWKQSQFPISGTRAKRRGDLNSEQPFLINPFDMNPARHFQYDDLTGKIFGATERGSATIDVCGLDRKSLENRRLLKVNKVRGLLKEYSSAILDKNVNWQNHVLKRLLEECSDNEQFAGVARWILAQARVTYEDLVQAEQAGLLQ